MGLLNEDDLYGYGPAPAASEAELDRALIGHLSKGGLLGTLKRAGLGLLNHAPGNARANNEAIRKGGESTLKKLKGKKLTPEEEAAMAENPAMGLGNADIGAVGMAGTFAGVGAKTADVVKLAEAKELLKKGASEAEIRGRTGWFKGLDDKWRFEIPDNNLKITGDSFEHPELFEAYPDMKDIPFRQFGRDEEIPGIAGYQDPETGEIGVRRQMGTTNKRKVLGHELQHDIQDAEGFAPGASPWSPESQQIASKNLTKAVNEAHGVVGEYEAARKDFLKRSGVAGDPSPDLIKQFEEWYPDLAGAKSQADQLINGLEDEEVRDQIISRFMYDAYYRQHGEVEARAVADRLDYTPEQRRMTPPLDTQDIAPEDIIVPRKGILDWFR